MLWRSRPKRALNVPFAARGTWLIARTLYESRSQSSVLCHRRRPDPTPSDARCQQLQGHAPAHVSDRQQTMKHALPWRRRQHALSKGRDRPTDRGLTHNMPVPDSDGLHTDTYTHTHSHSYSNSHSHSHIRIHTHPSKQKGDVVVVNRVQCVAVAQAKCLRPPRGCPHQSLQQCSLLGRHLPFLPRSGHKGPSLRAATSHNQSHNHSSGQTALTRGSSDWGSGSDCALGVQVRKSSTDSPFASYACRYRKPGQSSASCPDRPWPGSSLGARGATTRLATRGPGDCEARLYPRDGVVVNSRTHAGNLPPSHHQPTTVTGLTIEACQLTSMMGSSVGSLGSGAGCAAPDFHRGADAAAVTGGSGTAMSAQAEVLGCSSARRRHHAAEDGRPRRQGDLGQRPSETVALDSELVLDVARCGLAA